MAAPPRFLLDTPLTEPGVYTLGRQESHHAANVLRLREKDIVTLFDGAGKYGDGAIVNPDKNALTVDVFEVFREERAPISITIASAIPKGKRWQMLVEKCTELGVQRILPMLCGRSVVKGEGDAEKWRRWSVEAAKQSRRSYLPQIFEPMKVPEIIAWGTQNNALALLADPAGENPRTFQEEILAAESVMVMIGPEGGFTAEEMACYDREKVGRLRLSPYVLRIETAAATACALLMEL
jgi:RNA methyltransferase, RsmE family